MIAEQCISVDKVKITLLRVWVTLTQLLHLLGSIQTQQVAEPPFDWIVYSVSNWFIKTDLLQLAAVSPLITVIVISISTSFELTYQLER